MSTVKDHLGFEFESISSMCKHYNVSYTAFNNRIDRGLTLEAALTKEVKKADKPIDHTGKVYDSFNSMCKHYNKAVTTVRKRLKNGWSIEEALTTESDKKNANNSSSRNSIEYKGIRYNSWKELCEAYNMIDCTVTSRIKRGLTLDEALENKKKKHMDHLGNTYNTQAEMAKAYGITLKTLTSRFVNKWPLKEALETPQTVHNKRIECLGFTFESIKISAKAFGIAYDNLLERLKSIEVEAALLEKSSCSIAYIGINSKAYYKVGWSDKLVTTRDIIRHYRPDLLDIYDKENPTGEYRLYQTRSDSE